MYLRRSLSWFWCGPVLIDRVLFYNLTLSYAVTCRVVFVVCFVLFLPYFPIWTTSQGNEWIQTKLVVHFFRLFVTEGSAPSKCVMSEEIRPKVELEFHPDPKTSFSSFTKMLFCRRRRLKGRSKWIFLLNKVKRRVFAGTAAVYRVGTKVSFALRAK